MEPAPWAETRTPGPRSAAHPLAHQPVEEVALVTQTGLTWRLSGAGASLEDERVGWEQRPVPCGISDVRRAGWGLQSKGQRAAGTERRQTEAQDRRGRKQFSESQLWGGGCRASQEEREGQRGRGVGGRPPASGTLTGDSPSTRGPSLTRMAPLRPLRSSETLVQVSRATGSLLLVGGVP